MLGAWGAFWSLLFVVVFLLVCKTWFVVVILGLVECAWVALGGLFISYALSVAELGLLFWAVVCLFLAAVELAVFVLGLLGLVDV